MKHSLVFQSLQIVKHTKAEPLKRISTKLKNILEKKTTVLTENFNPVSFQEIFKV